MLSQISFDPLDFNSAEEAKLARDMRYRELKKQGKNVTRFVLRNQLRQYVSFGVEDGRVRDVYYIQINK